MMRTVFLFLAVSLLVACGSDVDPNNSPDSPSHAGMDLKPIKFSQMDGWAIDDHAVAFQAFLRSCADIATHSDTEAVGGDRLLAPMIIWKNTCDRALAAAGRDDDAARRFFESEFIPMRVVSDRSAHAFITGYYEPLLRGSTVLQPPYVYPVYAMPAQGTTYTRQQIDLGFIKEQAPVIAYVNDPVMLFFMQIEGSGSIVLDNKDVIHVGYGGSNGQPYVAIGQVLKDRGLMGRKEISMQSIRQWLYDNPTQMWQMMWENPHYVFFQKMISGGPFGTEKVSLIPGRSMAVDQAYIPLGMPVFVDTVVPGSEDQSFTITRKLVIAQDTGHSIIGPLRGDLFFGSGYLAEQVAGRMKSGGTFTVLVPRPLAKSMGDKKSSGSFFPNLF